MTQEQRYLSVAALIRDTCRKFREAKGGELDDLIGEAHVAWIRADRSFDPTVAKYTTWVRFKVWKGLLEYQRVQARHHVPTEPLNDTPIPEGIQIERLEFELSLDAARCLGLALVPSPDVLLNVRNHKRTALRIGEALAEYLLTAGWSGRRLGVAFEEIRENL